ncbi:phosphotriesterase family protein [Vulcanisaeta souniana]|uniref:Phosphotriesterase n=1 Tax=Vulcanisaeta souniana JCM 11219 TaxID=1293586 RepID=A0A830EDN8_9CREN|nr:phosphotriesterase [Vulcanisaeta souniana]BDR91375.1 phosphotriesterase [Vulcanisaeta souniana JCM 11219]GGI72698.1 phosphotriesterase [Vulcanisaeta souniana JCM 11219]
MNKIPVVGGGEISPSDMGLTLFHEHLRLTTEVVRWNWPHLYNESEEFRRAVDAVNAVKRFGVKTIVDLTVAGIGRDVRFDERVARATGVNIIMGTGFYTYTELPFYFRNRGIDSLVDVFMHDITIGIQGTNTRAVFVKAVIDSPGLTRDVEMAIRAVARTHVKTGAPIITHSFVGNRSSLELIRIFKEEGVDLSRAVIGHVGDTDDVSFIEQVLREGAFVGLDRFGLDLYLPLEKRVRTTIELIRRGWVDQILLSHDYCPVIDWYPTETVRNMVPDWSMTLIFEKVIPRLRDEGVTQEQVDKILMDNPRRLFSGRS